jgi:hypothetical protein
VLLRKNTERTRTCIVICRWTKKKTGPDEARIWLLQPMPGQSSSNDCDNGPKICLERMVTRGRLFQSRTRLQLDPKSWTINAEITRGNHPCHPTVAGNHRCHPTVAAFRKVWRHECQPMIRGYWGQLGCSESTSNCVFHYRALAGTGICGRLKQ